MIIAIIPARSGSKRIPNKNLQKLGNHSLVEHSILAAKMIEGLDRIYVSSNSEEVLRLAKQYETCPVLRCAEACTDNATDWDVLYDFINRTEWKNIELICYLRPTTPLRKINDCEEAIQKMLMTMDATGLRSVHEMSESAYKCMEVLPGNILKPAGYNRGGVDTANAPNHHYPKTYHPNGVIDIMRPEVIANGQTFGDRVMAHITEPVIEIDTPFDMQLAEFQMAFGDGKRIVFKEA